jgi:hypothetical protein
MPVPVQVWAPVIERSPADAVLARDLQRAQAAWAGEDHVWLQPAAMLAGAPGVTGWYTVEQGVRIGACLLPAEHLNAITLYHVDDLRHLYPLLGQPEAAQATLPEGLFRHWLNVQPAVVGAPAYFDWLFPRVVAGRVELRPTRVQTAAGPGGLVVTRTEEQEGERVGLTWPLPASHAPTALSPEVEHPAMYGPLPREHVQWDGEKVDGVRTEHHPGRVASPLWFRWPDPLGCLFPLGGGIDLLAHHNFMRQCIARAATGSRSKAERAAEGWVQKLSGEAESTLEKAWLLPRLMVDVQAALSDVAGRFGLAAAALPALAATPVFQELMATPLKVRRVHGWLGYFWWELLQDLRDDMTLRACERCGQIIRGGGPDRRSCTREEHPACGRERTTHQRKTRARQRSGAPRSRTQTDNA